MSKICINQKNGTIYPTKSTLFRPDTSYPEYIFKKEISETKNDVYEMIRNEFHMLKFDNDNYGLSSWNPLGKIVNPGDNVLIKPNMVLHANNNGCGEECLYTHPSLVATIIDYVIIALKGKGKIVVGDAPLQECNFESLIEISGYKDLVNYYSKKGVDIELVDFRNVKTYEQDGLHYLQEEEGDNGVIVQLNEKSTFYGIEQEKISNLRITNYDPRILQKHHDTKHHEYKVSKYVLDADVIINMPKPKTHRKAGVTISLKNLVGINANKEFLPHHTLGSSEEGGDAYEKKNYYLAKANEVLDIRNVLVHENEMQAASVAEKLYELLLNKGRKNNREKYWEGSWFGNNTIWKTITDLNRILFYANKSGIMKNEKQRKMFIVADMIVSGQKEGPLEPTPIYPGIIAMGDDPVQFDRVICSLMGFNFKLIPSLYSNELMYSDCPISSENEYEIISNNKDWNKKTCEEIYDKYSLEFQPTMGWTEKLGNKYIERLLKELKEKEVFIFGAGINGKFAYEMLSNKKIKVNGFIDNNPKLWGQNIIDGVKCYNPSIINKQSIVIGGLKDKFVPEVEKEVIKNNGKYVGTINQGL